MPRSASAPPALRATFRRIWSQPEYRALLLVMVLAGVSVSSYVPLISLLLVRVLRAHDTSVGLFSLTFLAAPAVGVVAGRYSDRRPSRIPLLMAVALWSSLGRVAMALAPDFGVAVVVSVVFGAVGPVLNAQAFAVLRDVTQREREPREATVVSTVRTAYCLGWGTGPLLGTALAGLFGYRTAIAGSAVFVLATLVPLGRLHSAGTRLGKPSPDPAPRREAADPAGRPAGAGLWVFAAACLLALSAESVRLSYLPVFAVDRLAIPVAVFGAVVAVAPLVEVVVSPVAGVLADRWGLKVVLVVGVVLGVGAYAAFATSSGLVGLFTGQVLNACFTAVLLGLGITYAQRLSAGGAGYVSSVFFGVQSFSFVLGGLVGSVTVAGLGLPRLFYAPMLLCVVASALLLFTRENATRGPAGGLAQTPAR